MAGVRLQLDRAGQVENYGEGAEVDADEVLATAPEITIGANRIRLDGDRYVVSFDLRGERISGRADGTVQPPALGERRSAIRHATAAVTGPCLSQMMQASWAKRLNRRRGA